MPLTHPAPHPRDRRGAARPACRSAATSTCSPRPSPPRRIVGITGTNGKSTTTALIRHLLAEPAASTRSAAAISARPCSTSTRAPDSRVFVLELSILPARPAARRCAADVAVWLNLTPDHLDRHGDLAGYAAAKERMFRNQRAGDARRDRRRRRAQPRGRGPPASAGPDASSGSRLGAVPRAGSVCATAGWSTRCDGRRAAVLDLRALGACAARHNHQNAAVAYAAVRALGLSPEEAARGFAELPGPAAPDGGGGAGRAGSGSSTTARRPTPTRPRARSSPSTRSSGSPAASPSRAASRACAPHLRQRPPGLPDRRGGRRDRGRPRRPGAGRARRHAGGGRRGGRARGRERGARARRGAAGAGLRLLRPVRELRGSAATLPRAGPARRWRSAAAMIDVPAHRPLDVRHLVVDRRPGDAGRRRRAGR